MPDQTAEGRMRANHRASSISVDGKYICLRCGQVWGEYGCDAIQALDALRAELDQEKVRGDGWAAQALRALADRKKAETERDDLLKELVEETQSSRLALDNMEKALADKRARIAELTTALGPMWDRREHGVPCNEVYDDGVAGDVGPFLGYAFLLSEEEEDMILKALRRSDSGEGE